MGAVELELLIKAVEKRLNTIPSLNLIDRIAPPTMNAQQLAHRGVTVTVPTTTILATYAQTDIVRVSDNLVITIAYRVTAKNQRDARAALYRLERQIRVKMTDPAWYRYAVAIDGTKAVEVHVATIDRRIIEGWMVSNIGFTIQRDEAMGGVP